MIDLLPEAREIVATRFERGTPVSARCAPDVRRGDWDATDEMLIAQAALRRGMALEKQTPIKFNINHEVRVKLTETGLSILKRQHDELAETLPSLGAFTPPKSDGEGWSRWQLWELMNRFGPHLWNGALVPFETEIEIGAKQP